MIDRDLLIEVTPEKIKAEDIEGTFYRSTTLGGSAFRVLATNRGSNNSGSVPAGSSATFTATFTTVPPVLTLPELAFSVYVDNDGDSTWLWPSGSNLTAANRPRITSMLSEVDSDFSGGPIKWKINIKNEDSGAHTYYVKSRVIYLFRGTAS